MAKAQPRPPESRRLLSFVARLYFLDSRDQSEIAGMIGTSRSTVSRLLGEARRQGIVQISVEDQDSRDRALEDALRARYGLRQAVVVRRLGGGVVEARRTIGYVGAAASAGLLAPGTVVGVAGGRTLAELVHYLAPAGPVANVRVVQLMGNIGASPGAIDAVELSRTLALRVAGVHYTLNAPAYVQTARARKLLEAHSHMQVLQELFAAMDLALVGIGTPTDSAFVESGVLDTAAREQLAAQGVVGEICGRFFDRRGRECGTGYRDRVIGIGLNELRRCPEVVAVSEGAHRREAIRAAIAGGLIKSLIIDDEGAAAVLGARPDALPTPQQGGARR